MLRRVRQWGYCTHCKQTTPQVRLNIDTVWRCQKCAKELKPPPPKKEE